MFVPPPAPRVASSAPLPCEPPELFLNCRSRASANDSTAAAFFWPRFMARMSAIAPQPAAGRPPPLLPLNVGCRGYRGLSRCTNLSQLLYHRFSAVASHGPLQLPRGADGRGRRLHRHCCNRWVACRLGLSLPDWGRSLPLLVFL